MLLSLAFCAIALIVAGAVHVYIERHLTGPQASSLDLHIVYGAIVAVFLGFGYVAEVEYQRDLADLRARLAKQPPTYAARYAAPARADSPKAFR